MTGPEHYREAERLIRETTTEHEDDALLHIHAEVILTRAQVHATLALAAATATGSSDLPAADWDQWYHTASAMPGILAARRAADQAEQAEYLADRLIPADECTCDRDLAAAAGEHRADCPWGMPADAAEHEANEAEAGRDEVG